MNDGINQVTNTFPNQSKKERKIKWWQVLIIVLMSITILVLCVICFGQRYDSLKCTSSTYSITINYNDDGIVGYDSDTMTYKQNEQNKYAKKIGMKAYLDEFSNWFTEYTNGDGTCTTEENAGYHLGFYVGD